MPLKQTLSRHWFTFQRELFPWLEEAWVMGERYQRLVRVVELARVEEWLPYSRGWRGRPLKDRAALARAFLAKAVLDVPTTRALVERLRTEPTLRRLCGWEAAGGVPSEATFSRAFAEFAASDLPGRLHEALLDRTLKGHLAGHVSRDSTAIPGRESPAPKPAPTARSKRRRGSAAQGRATGEGAAPSGAAGVDDAGGDAGGPAEDLRHRRQAQRQGISGELDRLQAAHRRDRRRHSGQLPADVSLGARQSGGDLARLTASRVDSLYDLMDSAYDAPEIRAFSQKLGQVPIIDLNPRRRPQLKAERKREALAQTPHRPGASRGEALPRALDRGAGERTAQGRVWRAVRDRFAARARCGAT